MYAQGDRMVWEAVSLPFFVERAISGGGKCQNVLEMALATAAGCGGVVGPGSW